MKLLENRHTPSLLGFIVCAIFLLASSAMLVHSLDTVRQADTQLVTYAFKLLDAVRNDTLIDYVLEARKYPFLPITILAGLYGLLLSFYLQSGQIDSIASIQQYIFLHGQDIDLVTRLFIFSSAVITLVLLCRLSKRFFLRSSPFAAMTLLLSGFLFPMFATAERPHMLIACMTIVAFAAALPLTHVKSTRNMVLAFAGAAAAFMTLQSGALTFIFPVLAYISMPEGFAWKKIFSVRLMLWSVAAVGLSLFIGYTFVPDAIMHGRAVSFDLGNDYLAGQSKWTGQGFVTLGTLLAGSEPFLLLAFLFYLLCLRTNRASGGEKMLLIYLVAFIGIFGLYAGTSPRFFLPILPIMALLAGSVVGRRMWLLGLITLVAVGMQSHATLLALRTNTFDLAREFVQTQTSGAIATTLPSDSFLGIPPTRASVRDSSSARERYVAALDHDLPGSRDFVPIADFAQADVLVTLTNAPLPPSITGFSDCGRIESSEAASSFLWAEIDWPIYRAFLTSRLGPDITIYCRN